MMSWNNITPAYLITMAYVDPEGMEAPLGYSLPMADWDYETEQP